MYMDWSILSLSCLSLWLHVGWHSFNSPRFSNWRRVWSNKENFKHTKITLYWFWVLWLVESFWAANQNAFNYVSSTIGHAMWLLCRQNVLPYVKKSLLCFLLEPNRWSNIADWLEATYQILQLFENDKITQNSFVQFAKNTIF